MTMQDLKTMTAMVEEAAASFKHARPNYTDEDLDTFAHALAVTYWQLFKRPHLSGKFFIKLVDSSVRLALSR